MRALKTQANWKKEAEEKRRKFSKKNGDKDDAAT